MRVAVNKIIEAGVAAKKPTKAESDYMGRVAALSCVACNAPPPSLVHHCREGVGMGRGLLIIWF